MKNRNVSSILILVFIILSLFSSCDLFNKEPEPDNDTGKDGVGGGNGRDNLPIGTPVPGGTIAEKLQWLVSNAENDKSYLLEASSPHEALAPQNLYLVAGCMWMAKPLKKQAELYTAIPPETVKAM